METKLPKITDSDKKALAIAETDAELLDAFYRLAQLLDKTEAEQEILSPMIIKEIYLLLLLLYPIILKLHQAPLEKGYF